MTQPAQRIDAEELLAHAGWVRALARSLVGDGQRADDVVQQTMVAAIEHPPRPGVPLGSWLARVARNLSLNARRADGRRARHESAAPPRPASSSPDESAARAETFRDVVDAVVALDPIYRDVVVARFFDELEMPDVARRLGVPVETARTRLKRALAMLRERLDQRHGGDGAAWIAALTPLLGTRRTAGAGAVAGAGTLVLGGALMSAKAILAVGAVTAAAAAGGWWLLSDSSPEARSAPDAVAPVAPAPPRPEPERVAPAPKPPRRRAEPEPDAATKNTSAPAPPTVHVETVVKGHVKTKSGKAVAGATVLAMPVNVSEPSPPGQSVESQVRLYMETIRAMRPRPSGSVDASTGADGAYSLNVDAAGTYWIWAWADGCDVRASAGTPVRDVRAGGTVDFQASDLDDLVRIAADRMANEADRIAALQALRGVRGGITSAVAVSMMDLLRTSKDKDVRRDVIRHLHHCGEPTLETALLDALRDDPDEGVREQAAKDIDDFLDHDAVVQALTKTRDADASDKVREEAAKTLTHRKR